MRRFVLLFGIVALAAGIWFLVSSVETVPVPGGGVPGSQVDAGMGSSLTGEGPETEELGDVADTGFERSEVEAANAGAAKDRVLVKILVRDKETGEPLPGAEVSYYENRITSELGPAEQEEYQKIRTDREKLTRRYGTTVLADSLGVAVVPVEEYIRTTGRHGELYGQVNIRLDPFANGDEEHKLELERDLTLLVQVLDSRGEPAVGVPVWVLPRWEGVSGNQSPTQVGVSEAPKGLLTAPHLQITLLRWKREEPYPTGHLVRARIPGMIEGGEPFDGEAPPPDPIVVRLPPTGRVFVQTVNAMGVRVPREVVRFLSLTAPVQETAQTPPNSVIGPQWRGQAMEDGRTRFDWVVLGKTFHATARVGSESLQKRFEGPLALDQDVHVSLSAESEVYILSGRVLDELREPLRHTSVRMRYQHGSIGGTRLLQLGDGGNFKTYVNSNPRDEEVTLSLLTVEDSSTSRPPETTRMYTMVGERSLVPGENDLGDLVLTEAPLVASGRVLMNGKAWGQSLNMNVQRLDSTLSRNGRSGSWRSEQLSVRYPSVGRFEIRGVIQPARYRLVVYDYNSGHLPILPIEFVPGAEDIEIALSSGGSLESVVLLDESISLQDLWLRLTPTEGQDLATKPDPQDHMANVILPAIPGLNRLLASNRETEEERHTFLWSSLWPGGYRFELLPRGARTPLMTIPDIHITGGQKNRDPRLDVIDLRGKLRQIDVRIVDAEGKVIENNPGRPVVLVNETSVQEDIQGYRARDGIAEILIGEPFVDLHVVARGYRPRRVSAANSDLTITLERFPDVVIRVPQELEIPEDHTLQATIRENEPRGERDSRRITYGTGGGGSLSSWLRPPTTAQEVPGSGEVALQVDGDGTYTVRLSLRNSETRRSATLSDVEPAEIDVRTSMGRQVFEIRIPEESLREALEQAKGG